MEVITRIATTLLLIIIVVTTIKTIIKGQAACGANEYSPASKSKTSSPRGVVVDFPCLVDIRQGSALHRELNSTLRYATLCYVIGRWYILHYTIIDHIISSHIVLWYSRSHYIFLSVFYVIQTISKPKRHIFLQVASSLLLMTTPAVTGSSAGHGSPQVSSSRIVFAARGEVYTSLWRAVLRRKKTLNSKRLDDPGCCHFVIDLPLVAASEKAPLVLLGENSHTSCQRCRQNHTMQPIKPLKPSKP